MLLTEHPWASQGTPKHLDLCIMVIHGRLICSRAPGCKTHLPAWLAVLPSQFLCPLVCELARGAVNIRPAAEQPHQMVYTMPQALCGINSRRTSWQVLVSCSIISLALHQSAVTAAARIPGWCAVQERVAASPAACSPARQQCEV